MPTKETSTFSHFFKEDANTIQDIINGRADKQVLDKLGTANKKVFPKISSAKEVSEDEFKAHWRTLRSFFRNANNNKGLAKGLSPVIMAPLFTNTLVGTDFPVWVADENFTGEAGFCLSLKEVLTQCLNQFAPNEKDANILKSNIERIIHIANEQLGSKPQLFKQAIIRILDELENQLSVSGDEVYSFNENLKLLKNTLPDNGVLLPYSNNTVFQLLEAAIIATPGRARKNLAHDIKQLTCRLKDLLRVEREKGPERKNPDKLKDSLEFADSMMDFNSLSSILPGGGSESIGEERVLRITNVVHDLEKAETILGQHSFLFIDELLYKNKNIDWQSLFINSTVETCKKGNGCATVSACFNKNITAWTTLFIAKRIGELELDGSYQPDIHNDYFEHFNWQNFSVEELNSCPPFILIADDVQLFDSELSKLSSVFSGNIPVKIVAVSQGNSKATKDKAGLQKQTELGALMLSHKNIYVAQSTSITPKYLFNGFNDGLSAFSPAFFNVLNADETRQNSYLKISATVESRDFPGFTFNGILGTPWGSRFEVKNNPQPDLPWPVHNVTVVNAEGEKVEMVFPFTFADRTVLDPNYHNHFMAVGSSYWNEDLIPLTDYIENSIEDNIGKVPFIWMMDTVNELQKIAVSWQLVLATQERLDFWRFLQENSGINNYHVTQAVEDTKAKIREQHEIEIEALKEQHQTEIETIRAEEAGKAMENLTSVLLNLDTTNVIAASTPTASAAPLAKPNDEVPGDAPAEVKEEVDEAVLSNDPYIDTALCTSCNECTDMNGKLFSYNADKMAYIADPKAGTFNELVEAAELCPVGIIHPGSPLNPDEPGLDDLIKRAEKFN